MFHSIQVLPLDPVPENLGTACQLRMIALAFNRSNNSKIYTMLLAEMHYSFVSEIG